MSGFVILGHFMSIYVWLVQIVRLGEVRSGYVRLLQVTSG